MLREIDSNEQWDELVLDGGKVLVEFFATWCPHCQKMQPVVEELASMEGAKGAVFQIDVDKMPQLANMFANGSVPTFIVFESGVPKSIMEGEHELEDLVDLFEGRTQ